MAKEKVKTELGIDENVEGLLCYVLGWVTGLVFYLVEKKNSFVKFHAVQSIVLSAAVFIVLVALMVLSFVPYAGVVFGLLSTLVSLAVFVLWIIVMVKAAQGEKFKLPVIGDFSEKYAEK